MSNRSNSHSHLTYKRGIEPVIGQPETITDQNAAMRLIEEIAACFVTAGCRVVKYHHGIRVYDCKDASLSDQSFEYQECTDVNCGLTPAESVYGRWGKTDRQKYMKVLQERGLLA